MAKQFRYSEIFRSIQGEGKYCGIPTAWIRFWGCNFECVGFGMPDPNNVDVEQLPLNTLDISKITRVEDLPVFTEGCDSSYTWSKRYAHLASKGTAEEISARIREKLPNGKFSKVGNAQSWHMAFTGGEPMMSQTALVEIMKQFRMEADSPSHITIETNGTQMPRKPFKEFFGNRGMFPGELFWSCSPKLSSSGEKWEQAIKPEVLQEYNLLSNQGQLKYVVDGTDECWDEVEKATNLYRSYGIEWPVYIMPVGATLESQEDIQKTICLQTLERGYAFSGRLHCWVFGNEIGT